jgi:hypothetical protein
MQKPTTDRLWRCVRYYLALCLSRGQADDTIRAKKYSTTALYQHNYSNRFIGLLLFAALTFNEKDYRW